MIDCANGAAYKVAPEALWELGAEVDRASASSPTASTSTDDVGSTAPDALAQAVREMRADIGIALDGDADRVVIVDEKGQIVDGDQMHGADRRQLARRRPARQGRGVVATVMSNLGLERYLDGLGLDAGAHRRSATATSLEHMREHGFNVGGEQSGHIILSDFSTTGDGLLAALQVLAVVKTREQAGERGLPPLRAAAADAEERALPRRQAAARTTVVKAPSSRRATAPRHGTAAWSSAPPAPSR